MENEETKESGLNKDQKSFLKFVAILGIVLLAIVAFRFYGSGNPVSGNVISTGSTNNGNVQVVKMHVENGQYILEPSSVKIGIPVRIEADISRMPGCSKSIVISAFNIQKSLSTSDNTIEFTPNQAGTFNIACSMNMYRGVLTVLDATGAKAAYVQPASTQGGCNMGGGSGGCGGGCGG